MSKKKTLTPDDFCKWLEGVLDATDGELSEKHLTMVREKLENVQKAAEFKLIPQFPQMPYQPTPWIDMTPKITYGRNDFEGWPPGTILCASEGNNVS